MWRAVARGPFRGRGDGLSTATALRALRAKLKGWLPEQYEVVEEIQLPETVDALRREFEEAEARAESATRERDEAELRFARALQRFRLSHIQVSRLLNRAPRDAARMLAQASIVEYPAAE